MILVLRVLLIEISGLGSRVFVLFNVNQVVGGEGWFDLGLEGFSLGILIHFNINSYPKQELLTDSLAYFLLLVEALGSRLLDKNLFSFTWNMERGFLALCLLNFRFIR